MANLTGQQILDTAISRIRDKSPAMRANLLLWLGQIMQSVLDEPREWVFFSDFRKTVEVAIVSGVATLPEDFEEVVNIQIGTDYFFDLNNILSDRDAFTINADFPNDSTPRGIQITNTEVVFIPGVEDGTATLNYRPRLTAVTDSTDETAWPPEFLNLFVRGLLTAYYEHDLNPSLGYSVSLDYEEMRKLKAIDNRRKPVAKFSRHGYLQTEE